MTECESCRNYNYYFVSEADMIPNHRCCMWKERKFSTREWIDGECTNYKPIVVQVQE